MKRRLPPWFKVPFPGGPNYVRLKRLLEQAGLPTVCQEARCPNIGQCFEEGTATFLLLGDVCTRHCPFCAVTSGHPSPLDPQEPERIAQAAADLGLAYAVLTSVTRDDLADGGASIFAQAINSIRGLSPGCRVEALVPDFGGSREALEVVAAARPDILGHNLETVPRLYPRVRPRASYSRSLSLLGQAGEMGLAAKSGLMVGLGEEPEEVLQAMADLRRRGCQVLTLGQYLSPSSAHLPVARFYTPEEFQELGRAGEAMGFRHVASGPLVRSSYRALHQAAALD